MTEKSQNSHIMRAVRGRPGFENAESNTQNRGNSAASLFSRDTEAPPPVVSNPVVTADSAAVEAPREWTYYQRQPDKPRGNDWVRIDALPSLFRAYDFDELWIRPFMLEELELIARSYEENDIRYMIQAVDNCVTVDANWLTIPDFVFLQFWLRTEGYPATPLYLPWTCDEQLPNTKVSQYDDDERKAKLAANPDGNHECGYRNMSPLVKNIQTIIDVETAAANSGYTIEEFEVNADLDHPRVYIMRALDIIDKIERTEYELSTLEAKLDTAEDPITARKAIVAVRKALAALNTAIEADETLQFGKYEKRFVEAARWVRAGSTLREKLDWLRAQPNLSSYLQARQAARNLDYGVLQRVSVTCGRCGAARGYPIAIDAATFLQETHTG